MRKSLLVLPLLFLAHISYSQTARNENIAGRLASNWHTGGTLTLALAQGGTSNWAPTGTRFSLAVNGFLSLYANRHKDRWNWDNSLQANYGLMNTSATGVIKNDDKLDLVSRLSYQLGKKEVKRWRISGLMNFRTQFYDGYDYDEANRKRVSAFLAPGTFVLSPGVEYFSKNKHFGFHYSPFSGRWILVANRPYELADNYGVMPNRKVRIEAGSFASVHFDDRVVSNVNYSSRLDLFSDYFHQHPGNIDVFWTNMVTMKVNRYLGVVYNFDLQYDDNTRIFGYGKNRAATQLKSILGVGLTVTF